MTKKTISISVNKNEITIKSSKPFEVEDDLQIFSDAIFHYIDNIKTNDDNEMDMLIFFLKRLNDRFISLPLFIDKEPNLN